MSDTPTYLPIRDATGRDITELVANAHGIAINSLDFGSGFLCDEDVIQLRQLARVLERSVEESTPAEWTATTHGAIKVESEHVTKVSFESPIPGTPGWQARCLCGWTGDHHSPTLPLGSERQKAVDLAAAEARAHEAEMLDRAREGLDV